MSKIKKPLLFTLALLPVAIAGGYLVTLMSVSSMAPSILDEAIHQIGSKELLVIVSAIQPIFLSLLCGFFGYIFAEKTGLMRSFRFEKDALEKTLLISLIGGMLFSLDAWTFARWIPGLAASYIAMDTFDAITWAVSVLYGGIIEEVMLRLFFMSLLAFVVWKAFFKKDEIVPTDVLIVANFIASFVFAAGHLPATIQVFDSLTPLLIFRCFFLNGGFGLVFGRLYRKYGIQYAMLAHMLLHIVSKTIWAIVP